MIAVQTRTYYFIRGKKADLRWHQLYFYLLRSTTRTPCSNQALGSIEWSCLFYLLTTIYLWLRKTEHNVRHVFCCFLFYKNHPVRFFFFLESRARSTRNTYRNCAETARLGYDCYAALQHLMLRWLRVLIWLFCQNNCQNTDLQRPRFRNLLRRNFDSGLFHNIENLRGDFSDFSSTCDCLHNDNEKKICFCRIFWRIVVHKFFNFYTDKQD